MSVFMLWKGLLNEYSAQFDNSSAEQKCTVFFIDQYMASKPGWNELIILLYLL